MGTWYRLYMTSDDIPGTQTLRHGLLVLRAVATGARNLTEVTTATGLSRSKVHRLLQALRQERFLRTDETGTYFLGASLIELGFQALDDISLVGIASPLLSQLSEDTLDTVHLGTELEGEALYLLKFPGHRGIEVRSQVGTRRPITRTGLGRSLILDSPERWESLYRADRERMRDTPPPETLEEFTAAMEKYSRNGYSEDWEISEPGIRCVAAPIRNASGNIAASISVSSAVIYMGKARMRELAAAVTATAAEISRQIGYGAV
ncbi:hypothetical protein HMPREF9237_00686 [Actinotignum schaalii FB123-CNA-2]|uniref:HTH iclR-type domain-containing protein n=2 Tax=Actinotignum schaalii TaxID=59505 RepID=S2VI73_9ACTO|nr:hypothetical protein HMPREF9237_00686 [Actinotignum schaalii FB123-CNA-2]